MKILSDLRVNRFTTMSTEGNNNPRAPWPSELLSQGAGGQEARGAGPRVRTGHLKEAADATLTESRTERSNNLTGLHK